GGSGGARIIQLDGCAVLTSPSVGGWLGFTNWMPEWLNRRWWRGAASLGSRRAPAVGRADEPMEWWMPDVDGRRQALGSSDSELEREGGTVARSRPPAAPPPPRSVGDFD
ncbi:unnamed protein product, partial [Urochloa humidicola]